MTGGPCWLRVCGNESSKQPASTHVGQNLVKSATGETSTTLAQYSSTRTASGEISVQNSVSSDRETAAGGVYHSDSQRELRVLEPGEDLGVRVEMVLDSYKTTKIHNEFEESQIGRAHV